MSSVVLSRNETITSFELYIDTVYSCRLLLSKVEQKCLKPRVSPTRSAAPLKAKPGTVTPCLSSLPELPPLKPLPSPSPTLTASGSCRPTQHCRSRGHSKR